VAAAPAAARARRGPDGQLVVEGIIAPWDRPVTVLGRSERFLPGSLTAADGAVLDVQHRATTASPVVGLLDPVGDIVGSEPRPEGLWARFRMRPGEAARTVWELVRMKTLPQFSVSFTSLSPAHRQPHNAGQGDVRRGVVTAVAVTDRAVYSDTFAAAAARTRRLEAAGAHLRGLREARRR